MPLSEMTDADLAHMLGWKPAVFTCKEGTLSSVIRKIADEAARREREACAALLRANAEACGGGSVMGAVLEANAEAILARGQA